MSYILLDGKMDAASLQSVTMPVMAQSMFAYKTVLGFVCRIVVERMDGHMIAPSLLDIQKGT